MHHRQFLHAPVLPFQPDIQQPLGQKAENALISCVIPRPVDFLFRLKQQRKQPVRIIQHGFPAHQHQVEAVATAPRHHPVKCFFLPRMLPRQHCPYLEQILPVMRMGVLRQVRFNPVMALFRQKNIRLRHQLLRLRLRQNPILLFPRSTQGKETPVVAQPVPVRLNIPRHPVQHRQLAEIWVLLADLIPRVVLHQPHWLRPCRASLHRRIKRIRRQRILFVQRYRKKNGWGRCHLHSPPVVHGCIVP